MQRVIVIDTDGTVRTLYSDALPLRELGRLKVRRASTVEFDEPSQKWRATTPQGEMIAEGPSREAVVRQEIRTLQERL